MRNSDLFHAAYTKNSLRSPREIFQLRPSPSPPGYHFYLLVFIFYLNSFIFPKIFKDAKNSAAVFFFLYNVIYSHNNSVVRRHLKNGCS